MKDLGDPNKPIGRILRRADAEKWNQSDLARRLDVTPQDITNWKTRGVPSDKLDRIAKTLRCHVYEILGKNPPSATVWPFEESISLAEFKSLGIDQQNEVEEIVAALVARLIAKRPPQLQKKSV